MFRNINFRSREEVAEEQQQQQKYLANKQTNKNWSEELGVTKLGQYPFVPGVSKKSLI